MDKALLVIDRDGTIIEDKHYLGKSDDWKDNIVYKQETLFLIRSLQMIFPQNTAIIFSNQSGVALGHFDEGLVRMINSHIDAELRSRDIKIDSWIYSPEIDLAYAKKHNIEMNMYIKDKSSRKPNPRLLLEELYKKNLALEQFSHIIVIGDSEDDKTLSDNIKGIFIKV